MPVGGVIGDTLKEAVNVSAVQDIINGLLLIARGISWFILWPLKIFGIEITGGIAQIIYIAVLFYVLYKIIGSWKIAIPIMGVIVIIGSIGFG